MEVTEKPTRPRWKTKRWATAVAAWLVLPATYFLSSGPAFYAVHRGWASQETAVAVYTPGGTVIAWTPLCDPWVRFNIWASIEGAKARNAEFD